MSRFERGMEDMEKLLGIYVNNIETVKNESNLNALKGEFLWLK